MKKFVLLLFVFMTTVTVSMAQSNPLDQFKVNSFNAKAISDISLGALNAPRKAMPIYGDEPITEAPAGTVVKNMIRKGFSYYYTGGGLYGGYNDTFAGEIVLGEDGCIYIKKPCASVDINTYLKLEPVEGEEGLYVMHTAQMVYVDMSYGTPYTYYATRLVLTELGGGQFTWQVETINGVPQMDVYFTYENGVLRQQNQTIVSRQVEEWDGYVSTYYYPYEIIGWTNSNGGWIGYGDGLMEFVPVDMIPTTLPDGAQLQTGSFNYDVLSSKKGTSATNGEKLSYAEVGDEMYVACPLDGSNMWIKGSINRAENTVSFHKQYLGSYNGVHEWFVPATYSDWRDVIDPEEDYGTWYRDYNAVDEFVMTYTDGVLDSDTSKKLAWVISRDENNIASTGSFASPKLQPLEERFAAPQNPLITMFDKFNGLWGEFAFYLPPVDETGMLLDKEKLYYRVYKNHIETPYTFKKSEYLYIPQDFTNIPYLYNDEVEFWLTDAETTGIHHWLCYYEGDWNVAGVQSVMIQDGVEKASSIVWSDGTVTNGIKQIPANENTAVSKVLRDGQIIITRNGVEYNVNGMQISK